MLSRPVAATKPTRPATATRTTVAPLPNRRTPIVAHLGTLIVTACPPKRMLGMRHVGVGAVATHVAGTGAAVLLIGSAPALSFANCRVIALCRNFACGGTLIPVGAIAIWIYRS